MTVSILDLHCLNAVTDDYENVASILEEVRRTSQTVRDFIDVCALVRTAGPAAATA